MTARRNYYGGPVWAVGGPGVKPGAAPAAEAASRMASAAGSTPDSVDNEAREPVTSSREPATSSVLGEERAPGAVASPGEPEADGAGRDGQAEPEVEFDLEALLAKAEQADAYLELARRTKADFENYRKRATREAAAAQDRGVAKLALALLPAVDNLDRAVAAAASAESRRVPAGGPPSAADSAAPRSGQVGGPPGVAVDGVETLVSGIKLVHADVIAALARVGIEPFSPVGEPFDPQHHEAVAQQLVEGAQPGTVAEVYQRGYRLGDSVLRPARVLVAG
jgi:molecular chaperone GrpE